MSQKARRTSFAFRAFCTSQEMTRSLSSRKVLRTISVADWNFVQNPLRWSLVGSQRPARLSTCPMNTFEARQHSSTERRSPPSAMALSVGSLTTTVRPMDSKNVVHSTPKR